MGVSIIVPEFDAAGLGGVRSFRGVPREIDSDKIRESLQKVMQALRDALAGAQAQLGAYNLKTIEVGLSVSAEGTIGIATAGVEASITLSFELKEG